MSKSTPKPGDRVAYAAAFLKNTGQRSGQAPFMRGTYIGDDPTLPRFGRVRWDNENAEQYAEADYRAEIKAHGELVLIANIAVVGSARFALNDL